MGTVGAGPFCATGARGSSCSARLGCLWEEETAAAAASVNGTGAGDAVVAAAAAVAVEGRPKKEEIVPWPGGGATGFDVGGMMSAPSGWAQRKESARKKYVYRSLFPHLAPRGVPRASQSTLLFQFEVCGTEFRVRISSTDTSILILRM